MLGFLVVVFDCDFRLYEWWILMVGAFGAYCGLVDAVFGFGCFVGLILFLDLSGSGLDLLGLGVGLGGA